MKTLLEQAKEKNIQRKKVVFSIEKAELVIAYLKGEVSATITSKLLSVSLSNLRNHCAGILTGGLLSGNIEIELIK